eukprot:CAMPEP_0116833474 /NCGR_PEP_ID=MMETSP0418-20121206/6457_1 /TAXON_ID=1158023 /ORGANISM="Astrosyne radiata, Strain 13vi08-1A" /LENGTH=287 /DNA_ID=CAMNT_0004462929 /DNA_START=725 /DNA_END=1588 /DNA_ORIENTATION=+
MAKATAALFEGDGLWDPAWKENVGEKTIKAHINKEGADVVLYSSWFCPFAQRAWIAMEEAKANYRWVEINPYQVDPTATGGYTKKALPLEEKRTLHPGFVEASPRGLVPAVRQEKDVVVWESLPVVEYIDAVFGGGKLVPEDPYQRSMVQIWSTHCTERIQKAYYRALMAQDPQQREEWMQTWIQECKALANAMVQDGGPYFLGDSFSIVDVALAPFWQRMIWVGGHYMGLEFPKDEPAFDRLRRWWEATSTRPSVAATMVCKERLIASYTDYSKNVATSDFAKTVS